MSTKAQIEANRANAQLSTGPKSEGGKAKSSLNAVKTGLTGATVLLTSDNAAIYEQHVRAAFDGWKPATDREKVLVQSLADTEWRLLRIPSLESGIYALGRLKFASKFNDKPEELRSTLLDAYIYQERRRDLTNLSIQESRLRRQREKDTAELMELQRERIAKRQASLNAAAVAYRHSRAHEYDFDPQKFGFEFSIEEIEECVALCDVRRSGIQHAEGLARIRAAQLKEERLAA